MEVQNKLISLLEKYIEEYREIKSQHKNKRKVQVLYEDTLTAISSNLLEENKLKISVWLNEIYKDDIYANEFLRIMSQRNKNVLMTDFIEKIKRDYYAFLEEVETLKLRKERNEQLFLSAKRVVTSIKCQTQISEYKNDLYNIKRIVGYYEAAGIISNREELLLINEIESYNSKMGQKREELSENGEYKEFLYNEIPDILSIGFQEHDVIEVSEAKQQTLERFVSEIINTLNYITDKDVEKLFDSYKVYNFEDYEWNYIITSVLNNYLEELMILYGLLIDKDVYRYKENRMEVVKNYYQTLEKYLVIRNYYTKIGEYTPEDISNDNLISEMDKILIYAHSGVNINKVKLISDMSNIPNEYYDTVYDLINRFKIGTLQPSEFKYLRNHKGFSGVFELRYDQVRIVLKHAKDNIYGILGVFAKKSDNDILMYRLMTSRIMPDISNDRLLSYELELSKNIESELALLVQQKGRKGTR